ncbi:PilC/PilY family type IV pilus protein [Thiotrichales bacterium HSG1]|nr:PilC/PilY family type IV pilus protein [Thiotrichales bacterium HSG1]
MLDTIENVNVGLGRFAALNKVPQPPVNAPIIFPVEFIDKDVSELEGEEKDSMGDITVSIVQNSDDAEQYEDSGEMFLYDDNLDMTTRENEVVSYGGNEVDGDSITTTVFVGEDNGANDGEELLDSNHKMLLKGIPNGNSSIYLGTRPTDSNKVPVDTNVLVGLRFKNINIPQNAEVIGADIEFTSDSSQTAIDNFDMGIYAAANDGLYFRDPSGKEFTYDPAYLTSNFPFITDENGSAVKDDWNEIPSVSNGQTFNSPNIKNVVQAIIDQDGWNSGIDKQHPYNSLVILLKSNNNSPDVSKSRSFYSSDNTSGFMPPKLRITWKSTGNITSIIESKDNLKYQRRHFDAAVGWKNNLEDTQIRLGRRCVTGQKFVCEGTEAIVGVHFEKLGLPKGAEILSAKIIFTHQNGTDSTTYGKKNLNLSIHAEDLGNPRDFTNSYGLFEPSEPASSTYIRDRITPKIQWNNVPQLPSAMDENTSWDGVSSLPDGLKNIWEGEGDAPSEYCTQDENGIITDPDCIKFTTPDLSTILQKVIDRDDWKRKNNVVFIFTTEATRDSDEELPDSVGFRRVVTTLDPHSSTGGNIAPYVDLNTNTTTLPRLEIAYKIAFEEEIAEKQKVGLRFEAIDVPRGARVESAYITFTSAEDNSSSTNLTIHAESTTADVFTEEPSNISNRSLTSASVSWSPNSWSKGLTYESPELKTVIQEVVDGSSWCGGDLAFIISSDDLTSIRKASSFDYMSGLSPELRIRFDTEDIKPGGGCVNQTYYSKISEQLDDGEEKISGTENGKVFMLSHELETGVRSGEQRLVGFHFRSLPIGNGAEVVGAHLIVNAKKGNPNQDNATFNVYGELSSEPKDFSGEDFDLSSRKATSTVEWEPGVWQQGKTYRTPNLASILQEIVNQPGWEAYNDAFFFVKGSGRRDIIAFDKDQALAASLRIQIKGKLGEDGEGDILTVRRRLQTLVKRMRIPNSSTPIVGALFESAQYYLGKNVVNGKTRNNRSFHLVSHPATHDSENDVPGGCNINMNPYAGECAGEKVVSGSAKYTPPIQSTSSCQSSHIVLLTDGRANVNAEQSANQSANVKSLLGSDECVDSFILNGKVVDISRSEKCGIDLADYLNQKKNIVVHTIGFQLGTAWLGKYKVGEDYVVGPKMGGYFDTTEGATTISTSGKTIKYIAKSQLVPVPGEYVKDLEDTTDNLKAVDYLCRLASPGGGNDEKCSGRNFYLAKTVEELSTAFSNISAQATTTNSSFAAPSISVNNLNNLRHKDDIYYSVFRPKPEPRWYGNIKRYQYKDGSLKDANGNEATNEEGQISDGSTSFWSDPGDGGNVTAGGMGGELDSDEREIYTYLGVLTPNINNNANLSNYRIQEFDSATTSFEKQLVDELMAGGTGDGENEVAKTPEEEAAEAAAKEEKAKNLIKWIIGKNVTEGEGSSTTTDEPVDESVDEPVEGDTEEEESGDFIRIADGDRWAFSDPLHSTPRVIFYDGTGEGEDGSYAHEESRLFVGTNDGLIRMNDVATGKEKWSFLPKELLINQLGMKDQVGDTHAYGVDATPTFFINTSDGKIIPSNGNFATMFVGMRRGGRNIYALDVTDKDGLPKLMWTVKGGENGFNKLGQTWSAPNITEVNSSYCNYPWCRLVVFGGGYDPIVEEEGKFNPAKEITMGNAIYMVEPESGELLWWASNDDGADLVLPDMKYAIPSDLSLQDTNGDGVTDRIYVGDVGGQLWRIDLDKEDDDPKKAGVIAKLAAGSDPDKRSFFYPPALANLKGQNILAAVTGARPNPLAPGNGDGGVYHAHDQFYAILDNEQDFDFSKPILLNNLANVTNWSSNTIDLTDTDKDGWYFNLQESDSSWIGEKGLGRPIIVENNVIFITYVPPSYSSGKTSSGSCGTFNPGTSRFYAINLLDGGPAFDKKEEGESEEFDEDKRGDEGSDRSLDVSTLAFDPVVMYTNTGDRAVQVGYEQPLVEAVPPTRIFWLQK